MAQRLETAVLKCFWCPGQHIDLNQVLTFMPEMVSGQDLGTVIMSLCQASTEVQSIRQLHYPAPGEACEPGLGEFPSVPKSSPSPKGLLTLLQVFPLTGHLLLILQAMAEANCPLQRMWYAPKMAVMLLGACEPLPGSYRADLVVHHCCAGTQRVRGQDHNQWV